MGAFDNGLFDIAFHKTELFESFGERFAGEQVNIPEFYAGFNGINCLCLGVINDIVNFTLFFGEFSADGYSSGNVASVVQCGFGAAVVARLLPGRERGRGADSDRPRPA